MADQLIPGMSGMQGLNALLQQQMERGMAEEPQRRAAVDQRAGALATALQQRPDADTQSAQRLFAAASGFGKPGNFWGALAEAGNRYISLRAQQEEAARAMGLQEALKNYEVSRNAYKDFGGSAINSTGVLSPFLHAALDPIKNIGGAGYNRLTGEAIIPKGYETQHAKLYEEFFKRFTEAKDPDAAAKAKSMADWYVSHLARNPNAATGRTQPGGGLELPQREAAAPEMAEIAGALAPSANTTPEALRATIDELNRAEKNAVLKGDYARAMEIKRAKGAFLAAKRSDAAPEQIPYKDEPKAKMEEATGAETGKVLAKTYEDMNAAAAASSELKIQLAQLAELYKTPNLPEGQLGEKLQGIKSSMKSLGIDVQGVGEGDLVQAIGGKLALLTRTADGGNLMPGAMSDFEQQILRSLAPGLRQTQEGRVALVGFLNQMSDIRIRLASEANKMAATNRGILPSDWYQRRDRILKEEQARMVLYAQEVRKKYFKEK